MNQKDEHDLCSSFLYAGKMVASRFMLEIGLDRNPSRSIPDLSNRFSPGFPVFRIGSPAASGLLLPRGSFFFPLLSFFSPHCNSMRPNRALIHIDQISSARFGGNVNFFQGTCILEITLLNY